MTYLRSLAVFSMILFLTACGAAHVRTDVNANDLFSYDNVLIKEVKVYSLEAAAKDNDALQLKLKDWEMFSRNELESYVENSQYKLVDSIDAATGQTLLVDLDVNVTYGNRALRWAVGFGAGKGGVNSVLTVKDAQSGEVKFRARADSDLSMGGAGGDVGAVLKRNIRKLVDQYPER